MLLTYMDWQILSYYECIKLLSNASFRELILI